MTVIPKYLRYTLYRILRPILYGPYSIIRGNNCLTFILKQTHLQMVIQCTVILFGVVGYLWFRNQDSGRTCYDTKLIQIFLYYIGKLCEFPSFFLDFLNFFRLSVTTLCIGNLGQILRFTNRTKSAHLYPSLKTA